MSRNLQREILARARRLIGEPRRWTRYAAARDSRGSRCAPNDDRAARYCVYGALLRAAFELTGNNRRAEVLARAAENEIRPDERISKFNDSHSHRAVLRLIDEALARKN
jgi:hypothetical protein